RLPPCWCGSSAYQVRPPSTRIGSFSALLTLWLSMMAAVGLASREAARATSHVKRVVDAIERAVPAPQIEIIVDRRARWQVLGDRPPLAAGAQDIHQAVDDFAHVHRPPVAAALGQRNERLHQRPFLVRQVARIAQPAPLITPAVLARPHRRPLNESGRLP